MKFKIIKNINPIFEITNKFKKICDFCHFLNHFGLENLKKLKFGSYGNFNLCQL